MLVGFGTECLSMMEVFFHSPYGGVLFFAVILGIWLERSGIIFLVEGVWSLVRFNAPRASVIKVFFFSS